MALGWLGILKCLVLVLPLVSFIPEGADAAETLVRQEAGLEQLASAGGDWNSVPGLKFPGAVAPDVKDLAGCQAFCSEREQCFAITFSNTPSVSCVWAAHTLDYDTKYTFYAQGSDGNFIAFSGMKQLDDPLTSPAFVSKIACENDCRRDKECKSFTVSNKADECFMSKQGMVYDATYTYYEKSAPKDLEIISKALAAKQAEYKKVQNSKIIKEKGEKQTQELNEKNAAAIALSKSKEAANAAEKEAQATAKEVNHKQHEKADAAKRADAKDKQDEAEFEATTLTLWKDKKEKSKISYAKSSKQAQKGAALMQAQEEELKLADREVATVSLEMAAAEKVKHAVMVGKGVGFFDSVKNDKFVAPIPIAQAKGKETKAKLEMANAQSLLLKSKIKLRHAESGKDSEEVKTMRGEITRLTARLEKNEVRMSVVPSPELSTDSMKTKISLQAIQADLRKKLYASTPAVVGVGVAEAKDKLIAATALEKQATHLVDLANASPYFPETLATNMPTEETIAGPNATASDNLTAIDAGVTTIGKSSDEAAAKNEAAGANIKPDASKPLIAAGKAMEKSGDKVADALTDLSTGIKGPIAKEEVGEAEANLQRADKQLNATISETLSDNPATVMDVQTEVAKKVSEGVPKPLAELLAKRDLDQVKLAAEQKKMESLIATKVADIKQVELSSGFSEESREKAKAMIQERKLKKETAAKEASAKILAELALKKELKVKKEKRIKAEIKAAELAAKAKQRAEKAEKLSDKNERVAKVQAKVLESKAKTISTEAAKVELKTANTDVTLKTMAFKESALKKSTQQDLVNEATKKIKALGAQIQTPGMPAEKKEKLEAEEEQLVTKTHGLKQKLYKLKRVATAADVRLKSSQMQDKYAKAGIVNADRNEAKLRAQKTAKLKEQAKASADRAKELATKLVEDRKMKQADESALEQSIQAAATAFTPELKASTKAALQNAKAQLLKSKRTVTEVETQKGLANEKKTKQDREVSKEQEKYDERAAKKSRSEYDKKQNAQLKKQMQEEKAAKVETKEQMFKDQRANVMKAAVEKRNKRGPLRERIVKKGRIKKLKTRMRQKYTSFRDKYRLAFKKAETHEKVQKHKIMGPELKEAAHKGELGQKKEHIESSNKLKVQIADKANKRHLAELNVKAGSKEELNKNRAILKEMHTKRKVALIKVERKTKSEEKAEKTAERGEKEKVNKVEKERNDKEMVQKKKKAAIKEDAAKKEKVAKKKAAEKQEKYNNVLDEKRAKVQKAKAASDKLSDAQKKQQEIHQKKIAGLQKLASNYYKARPEKMKFESVGEGYQVALMAPKPTMQVIKVGGLCVVEGIVQSKATSEVYTTLAILPPGCLPNRRLIFNQVKLEEETAVQTIRVDVLVSGEILAMTNNEPGSVISMDGIVFAPQGAEPMTNHQEKACKGAAKVRRMGKRVQPPPEQPGKLNWMALGCWKDGGGPKALELGEPMMQHLLSDPDKVAPPMTEPLEAIKLLEEGESQSDAEGGRRRRRRRSRRRKSKGRRRRRRRSRRRKGAAKCPSDCNCAKERAPRKCKNKAQCCAKFGGNRNGCKDLGCTPWFWDTNCKVAHAAAQKKLAADQAKESSGKRKRKAKANAELKNKKVKEVQNKKEAKQKSEIIKIREKKSKKARKIKNDAEKAVKAKKRKAKQEKRKKEKTAKALVIKKKKEKKAAKEKASKRRNSKTTFTPANLVGYRNKGFAKKKDPVRECAAFAQSKEAPYFAIQEGGWCSLQMTPSQKWTRFGAANNCMQGVGGKESNTVYEVVNDWFDVLKDASQKYKPKIRTLVDSVGCFQKNLVIATASKLGLFMTNKTAQKKAYDKDPVKGCAKFAVNQSFEYYSIGKDNVCYTGKLNKKSFTEKGPSGDCKGGKGDPKGLAWSVYRVAKRIPYKLNEKSENVALGRPTEQSSVADRSPSWRAIDGNLSSSSKTHPASKNKNNWWRIELKERTRVQAVQIWNGKSQQLKAFSIHIADTTYYQNTPTCGLVHSLKKEQNTMITCDQQGKYVYLVNLDNRPMDVREVRIWTGQDMASVLASRAAKKGVVIPPLNVANMSFGTRRRSDATSYKPKGKKMMKVVAPKLSNGWANYGLGYGSANVKVQGFLCMVSGVIHGANFGLLATLPAQCRPKKSLAFMLNHHYDTMRVNVHPDGTVMWAAGSMKHSWVSLSGITFSTSPHHAKMKMENGWMPFDKDKYPEANFVVENRLCVLGGFIFAGKWDVVAVLPPQCRPIGQKVFNAPTGPDLDKLARVNVYPDGRIVWTGGQQTDAFLSLNGIIFAAQKYSKPKLERALTTSRLSANL